MYNIPEMIEYIKYIKILILLRDVSHRCEREGGGIRLR